MRWFVSWVLWTLVMWVAFMAIHRLVPVYSEVQAFLTRRAELWALTR
jgi:hypothetical protein